MLSHIHMPSYAEIDIDTAVSFVHLSVCLFISLAACKNGLNSLAVW